MEQAEHVFLLNEQKRGRSEGGCGSHADGLAGHAAFAKKVGRTKHGEHRFFPCGVDNREFYAALLDIEDGVGFVTLGVDLLTSPILSNFPRYPRGVEKRLWVERS